MLDIGKITNTHGLRGEVKVVPWTDTPEVFENIEYAFVNLGGKEQKLTIRGLKYQKSNLIIRFAEIPDINEAERYKNAVLYTDRSQLGELPEGVYYIADLIGLSVIDEDGKRLGTLKDVFSTGSNDVYTVQREGKKDLLLPVIDDVVLNVDLEAKKITVHVMEGLDEL